MEGSLLLPWLIAAFIIIADQATKYYAATILIKQPGYTVPIISNILHLTYAENKGAAFSILQNQRWLFITLTIIICIVIIFILITHSSMHILLKISLSLILGGAIGNLIDRIKLGYVIDFIDFRIINYPIFNLADSAVVIGTILLSYYVVFLSDKKAVV